MASYAQTVEWVAQNDAAGDTPILMPYAAAFDDVKGIVSACVLADFWSKSDTKVTDRSVKRRVS